MNRQRVRLIINLHRSYSVRTSVSNRTVRYQTLSHSMHPAASGTQTLPAIPKTVLYQNRQDYYDLPETKLLSVIAHEETVADTQSDWWLFLLPALANLISNDFFE